MNRTFPTLRSWILPHLLTAPLILAGCADDSAGTGGGSPSGTGNGTSNGPGQGGSGGSPNIDDVKQGACDAGEAYDCKVHNPYGCLTGRQQCVDGQWSSCGLLSQASEAQGEGQQEGQPEGDYFGDEYADKFGGEGMTLRGGGGSGGGGGAGGGAPAAPVPCDGAGDVSNNDCDPTCQGFAPPPPTFGGGYPADWESGTFNNYPPQFLNAGLPNNCDETANNNDCQFDHYCVPDANNGSCQPYEPGETNPACAAGVDITIGLPCEGFIPVCNRGGVAAAANSFHLDHGVIVPADVGTCGGIGANCPVSVAIAPGECEMISTDCGTPGVPADDIVPGEFIQAHGVGGECNCGDNMGYYATGADVALCGQPACDGAVSGASTTPITLFIALDVSGSMNWDLEDTNYQWWDSDTWDDEPPSRMSIVRPALIDFVEAPESAGLGVVTRFWPSGECSDDTSCTPISSFGGPPPAGACAFGPCTAQAAGADAPLADGCSAEVTATCDVAPRCCGLEPSGTCATTPCATSASPLADDCNTTVGDVCGQTEFRRCCGLQEGGCNGGRSPCTVQAAGIHMGDPDGGGALTSCNNGGGGATNNTGNGQIRDVCDDNGFRYCCGGAPIQSATAWNHNLTLANLCVGGGAVVGPRCYDGAGTARDCTTHANIAAAPVGSLAADLRAFCLTAGGAGCCTNGAVAGTEIWTTTCSNNFEAYWSGLHDGIQLCGATGPGYLPSNAFWNDDCRAQYIAKDGDACNLEWDAACVAEYEDEDDGGSGEENDSCEKNWDANCVDEYNLQDLGACVTGDACNIPSAPTGCTAEGTCPTVLPAGEADLVSAFTAVSPGGGTPSYIALAGATDFCINFEAQRPGERCVVVFVSDGDPNGCNILGGDHQDNTIAVADAAYQSAGIFTFTIGIPGGNNTFMDEVAIAGGTGTDDVPGSGTDDAFIIPADGSTATAALLAALNEIKNTFACDYTVDPITDPTDVTVRWNNGAASPPALTLVTGTDDTNCTGGLEYYMPSDTQITLCPAACTTVTGDPASNLEVTVECEPAPSGGTVQAFTAGGACDSIPGTYPKWTVMYYAATIPGTSSIAVNARTAIAVGGPMRSWHAVDMRPTTVAGAQNMTSAYATSDLADPPSLELALGGEAFGEDLELEFLVDSSGGAPSLDDYEVHFTCAFSE